MRNATAFRLLVPAVALLAAACTDQISPVDPESPPTADGGGAERGDLGSTPNQTQWADGYLRANGTVSGTYMVNPSYSFNRAARFGGAITVTKVDSTTGRYVVTFPNLSRYLGGRSTLHVSGSYDSYVNFEPYCKPASAYLASDKVEVRCFKPGTGAPANADFNVLVTRSYGDLAFAYAHQETAASYSPSSAGSWNPAGTMNVVRTGVGQYRVTFNGLGSQLPPNVGGHVQVNAVGTSNAYCNPYNTYTNGTANLSVDVRCFAMPTGAPVDRRFTVLFLLPADHLAYAWAHQPAAATYSPLAAYSSNPDGAAITVARVAAGQYFVDWAYLDRHLLNEGNAQVTAYGSNALCRIRSKNPTRVYVNCFTPDGAPADTRFTVLYGS